MKKRFKILFYCNLFIAIFFAKMIISTAPMFLSLDKKVVSAAIMQLELENEAKKNTSDAKEGNNLLKKGVDFMNDHEFGLTPILKIDDIDYHYVSKEYIKMYFPRVPTPPPNQV